MKNDIDKYYTEFHKQRMGVHAYPSEFLVRTMLGKYPNLKLKQDYKGKKILDLGFGDGRNMILLSNIGAEIYGVEITDGICDSVRERMNGFGIETTLKTGSNSDIPFDDETFDYVVSSSALHYIKNGETFQDNKKELLRVMKKGAYLISSLGDPASFIFDGAEKLENGHYVIRNDPYELRNGIVQRGFKDEDDLRHEFGGGFTDISVGHQSEDYYGMKIEIWLLCARKK